MVLVVTPMLFPSSRRATPGRRQHGATAARPHAAQRRTPRRRRHRRRRSRRHTAGVAASAAAPPCHVARATTDARRRRAPKYVAAQSRAPCPRRCRFTATATCARAARRDAPSMLTRGRGPLLRLPARARRGHDRARHAPVHGHAVGLDASRSRRRRRSRSPTSRRATAFARGARYASPNAPPGRRCSSIFRRELRSVEADTLDDLRHLAYGFKRPRRDVVSVPFAKLDSLAHARRHRRDAVGVGRATSTGSSRSCSPVGSTDARRDVPRTCQPRRELRRQRSRDVASRDDELSAHQRPDRVRHLRRPAGVAGAARARQRSRERESVRRLPARASCSRSRRSSCACCSG